MIFPLISSLARCWSRLSLQPPWCRLNGQPASSLYIRCDPNEPTNPVRGTGYPSRKNCLMESLGMNCASLYRRFEKFGIIPYLADLESRQLAPGTVNVRLASVLRLAYMAADSGLSSCPFWIIYIFLLNSVLAGPLTVFARNAARTSGTRDHHTGY